MNRSGLQPYADCLRRIRQVSPVNVLFGDDAWGSFLVLAAGGLVLLALMREFWPLLLVLLVLAGGIQFCRWCREHEMVEVKTQVDERDGR
jgi:hypothetical protein